MISDFPLYRYRIKWSTRARSIKFLCAIKEEERRGGGKNERGVRMKEENSIDHVILSF